MFRLDKKGNQHETHGFGWIHNSKKHVFGLEKKDTNMKPCLSRLIPGLGQVQSLLAVQVSDTAEKPPGRKNEGPSLENPPLCCGYECGSK